jgi:hypothetical protein
MNVMHTCPTSSFLQKIKLNCVLTLRNCFFWGLQRNGDVAGGKDMAGWGKKDLMLHISTRCGTELAGLSPEFLALMNLLPAEPATVNMLTYGFISSQFAN